MRSRAGMALGIVLLLSLILMMLAGTLVQRVKLGSRFELADRNQQSALWAAQAGIAFAESRLSSDPTWSTSVVNHSLPDSQSTFTIRFSSADSVNNLAGATQTDGPLGLGTVPPRQVFLVVEGLCSGRTVELTALLGPQGLTMGSGREALLASGNISLEGWTQIDAFRSADDASVVDANVVSTKATGTDVIQAPGGSVQVAGKVSSNAPLGAINSANMVISKGIQHDAQLQPPKNPDIPGRVTAKAGATTPALAAGTANLVAGDYHFPAGLNYDGDLDLSDANLYIDGPLNVTGSISGSGSVFCNGNATLLGSAELEAKNQGLALYVEGDLSLSGLDGGQYLKDLLAGDAVGMIDLQNINTMFDEVTRAQRDFDANPTMTNLFGELTGRSTTRFGNGATGRGGSSDSDMLNNYLKGYDLFASGSPFAAGGSVGTGSSPLNRVRRAMLADTSPANATVNRFVKKRWSQLSDPTDANKGLTGWHSTDQDALDDLDRALNTGDIDGLTDALNDMWGTTALAGNTSLYANRDRLRQRMLFTYEALRNWRMGTAVFRGNLYCRGNLTCNNDLRVMGSVVAGGPNSNIRLKDTKLTFVPEVAQQSGASLGIVGMRCWYRRK